MGTKPVPVPDDMQTATPESRKRTPGAREGFTTLTPYLIVSEAADLIDFVKQTFGAEEIFRSVGSAGGIHCEMRLDDSMLMIGGGGPGLA